MTADSSFGDDAVTPRTTDANVTLVEGSSFCISAATGNIVPGAPMGLFVQDTRLLSQFILEVDGSRIEPLAVDVVDPHRADFVARAGPRPRRTESTLLVVRQREIGDGMRERIRIRNLASEPCGILLLLRVGADFADLFDVKTGRRTATGHVHEVADDTAIEFRQQSSTGQRAVRVQVIPVEEDRGARVQVLPGSLLWHLVIPSRSQWGTDVLVEALVAGRPVSTDLGPGTTSESPATRRAREWRGATPVVGTSDAGLAGTLARSREDLGALRMFDPQYPDRVVVAAGAPWFMALFGRDSLLASWMALPVDVGLALGTVRALADSQGTMVDPLTEEEPGRILHERRYGRSPLPVRGGDSVYYGSVDATPLFVMLVGELRRWGLAQRDVDALLPAVDRALEWIVSYGDRDGDGFVEYQRATDRGLRNQGWKDSSDGVNFADGTLADTPIALCEVQGYVYGAFLARAHFAREMGDTITCQRWIERAAALKDAFNERFWLPDRQWYAVGLDRHKRPIDALASNMGHCLWTGIVDEQHAPAVVEHLLGPQMFSGWGVRTLSSTMGAYNPMSYHNGSVWPHDNALLVAGLMRYGFVDDAVRVATAVLDAAEAFGGRLPELFCGFDRSEFPRPIPYPTACSPQAWAAATPIHLLRSLLRFDPWVPFGEIRIAPAVPDRYLPIRLRNVALGNSRIAVDLDRDGVRVAGIDPAIAVIHAPRATATALERR